MTKTMTLKSSASICLAMIKDVGKMGSTYEALVHDTATACLNHAKEYHDVTLCVKLLNTMAETCKGYVVNELAQWFKRHSPIAFEYSPDRKTILNATEEKDKDGNLKKAYSPPDILEKAPMHLEADTTRRTQVEVQPISYAYLKDRIKSLQNQIAKAIEPDGRGILGPNNTILHKGDAGYQVVFDSMTNYVKGLTEVADKMIPFTGVKDKEPLSKNEVEKPTKRTREKQVAEKKAA